MLFYMISTVVERSRYFEGFRVDCRPIAQRAPQGDHSKIRFLRIVLNRMSLRESLQ